MDTIPSATGMINAALKKVVNTEMRELIESSFGRLGSGLFWCTMRTMTIAIRQPKARRMLNISRNHIRNVDGEFS